MRNLFILATSILLLVSCDPIESIQADNIVVISPEDYEQTLVNSSYAGINETSIEGDVLTITYCASGCDGSTWVTTLFDAGIVMETMPVQRNLILHLENLEACTAVPCKTETYDLTPLHAEGESSVLLNIYTYSEDPIQILYEF